MTILARTILAVLALPWALALLPTGVAAQDRGGDQETGSARVRELKVMTYNVLADELEPIRRMRALLAIMREEDPDIIALQEVAPWSLERILQNAWIRSNFKGSTYDRRNAAPGGQYILSKFPIARVSSVRLPGEQERTVVSVWLDIDGVDLQIATIHMERPLAASAVRAEQLDAVFLHVESATEAIVLGDFNFGDGADEEARLDERYVDVWRHLRPDDPGFTWNREKSPMARAGSAGGETSRRLDRILLRSASWRPAAVRIVGDTAITDDGTVFPSDHFGLVATLRRAEDR